MRNSIRPLSSKEYFDLYLKDEKDGKCKNCRKETSFKSLGEGYSVYCSTQCANGNEQKKTIIKNRFTDDPDKVKEFAERYRKAISETDQEILIKRRYQQVETTKTRYGADYLSKRTKSQWRRRTTEDIEQLVKKSIETKRKNGTLDLGGFINSNKRIEVNGKSFFCQGYEDQVIRCLIDECNISEQDVLTGRECPRVLFDGNQSGWHRPDIFIKSHSLYVEVKSEWTFFGKEEFLKNAIEKQNAVLQSNFNHVIIVIKDKMTDDDKQNLKLILDMTISSQDSFESKVQRLSLRGVQPNRVWGWKCETS